MVTQSAIRRSFEAHPEALRDLRMIPSWVRDSALLALQQVIRVQHRGPLLERHGPIDLRGCRKLYLDDDAHWRAVYQERHAPSGDQFRTQIYLLAVGPRAHEAVYRTAARRLRAMAATPTGREEAALTRSPHTPGPSELAVHAASSLPPVVVTARPPRHP
ncbi:hypothetical protein ABH940_005559 [Streptacidiphilus sp. BW17]|uniref:hypothetical protein n=1 Tax=Streptacidiphilus sp. BW17 TaxID=3156274 RepID=UPI003519864D